MLLNLIIISFIYVIIGLGDSMFVEVLIEINSKKLDRLFTYLVPEYLKKEVEIGKRVLVPFNNRELEGFIMNVITNFKENYELKEIISVIDDIAVLNNEMIKLGKYISDKTLSPLISAYQTMLPTALKAKKGTEIKKKYLVYLKFNEENNNIYKLNSKQQEIIKKIRDNEMLLKTECSKISPSSVKTLLEKNILIEVKEESYRLINNQKIEIKKVVLNKEQQIAVNTVLNSKEKFKPFLLYGVTGSGKTEVYMNIIERVISERKEAIVLVPEISLTPQMVSVFQKRFGRSVAILHSGLSNGEKYDEWRRIYRKEVSIVIGARSAIYAPFTNLGVIIIDEEHSATYKQENTPKYSAIEIAIYRAKKYKCPLILGSATPSLESFTRYKMGIYEMLELKNRVNNNTPNIYLVDMREEIKRKRPIFSKMLFEKIKERLDKKEQIIILLNRRGYSTTLVCHSCGHTFSCPNCDIPLTYHKANNHLRCHYCNYTVPSIRKCSKCNCENINYYGLGTQKIEEELKRLFESARIVRMDIDTTNKKGMHEKIITDFGEYKYDILVGTQMISKGLDFAKVTLVGVINGDATLNIPDFRSAERTFQLLNQVAGRSGRGDLSGEVVIQSFNIDHYSILTAANNDYQSFYEEEIKIRQKLNYPPFCNISLIKIFGKEYEEVSKVSENIKVFLEQKNIKDLVILGPSNAVMPKINNIYYMQIILKYKKSDEIILYLKELNKIYLRNNKVTIDIDLNPSKI